MRWFGNNFQKKLPNSNLLLFNTFKRSNFLNLHWVRTRVHAVANLTDSANLTVCSELNIFPNVTTVNTLISSRKQYSYNYSTSFYSSAVELVCNESCNYQFQIFNKKIVRTTNNPMIHWMIFALISFCSASIKS